MTVGKVGRPHGLAGAFVVERPSDDEARFARGALLHVDGEVARVIESKRGGGGRVVIKLDRRVDRGAILQVPKADLPAGRGRRLLRLPAGRVGGRRGGRSSARSRRGRRRLSGQRRPRGRGRPRPAHGRRLRSRGRPGSRADRGCERVRAVRIDVFTLIPHAFAWMTEQRPVAAVLGERARAAAAQLPRLDAAPRRAGGRRAVRRRRRHGPPRGHGRRRAGRRLRRAARPPR